MPNTLCARPVSQRKPQRGESAKGLRRRSQGRPSTRQSLLSNCRHAAPSARLWYAAATTYQKAIDADSEYMAAYGGLARVKFATQDVEGIVELMQTALEADAKYAEGYLFLGTALNQLGRQHEAIEPLKRATQLDKKNADAHFRLGEAHYGLAHTKKPLILDNPPSATIKTWLRRRLS